MKSSIGFRMIKDIKRPGRDLVEAFAGIPSSNIGDNLNRLYCMRGYMNPYNQQPLLGTALTVKAPVGDNLMIHIALDLAQPGDIIVVDGESSSDRALIGEMMISYAQSRGIAGFVIDGAIRDIDAIRAAGIPVYAKGVTPQGPFKNGPGEINVPISCGGQVVFPGDILIGDQDGIVVVRPEFAAELAEISRKKMEKEQSRLGLMRQGQSEYQQHSKRFMDIAEQLGAAIEQTM